VSSKKFGFITGRCILASLSCEPSTKTYDWFAGEAKDTALTVIGTFDPMEPDSNPSRDELDRLLFVYGTLIPGLEPAGISAVVQRMNVLGDATLRGTLYDLGPYPGIVLNHRGIIRGKLVRLSSDSDWKALDAYEGCPLPDSEDGLFSRVQCTALDPHGRDVDCWVYVYNRAPSSGRVVEGGCWLTHRSLHKMIRT
jgi:gamma-glutamylcyclotransferase (GGCT)/AIG2-like uncharacterized protein YtfP